ncbi:MAG: hypothetical protein V1746_02725, partial [bacterium]
EFNEIAQKMTALSHTREAILAMAKIGEAYVSVRKDNLLFATDENYREVLTPLYEHLFHISHLAIGVRSETICTEIIEAFRILTLSNSKILEINISSHVPSDLFAVSLKYLEEVISEIQESSMDTTVMRGAETLRALTERIPNSHFYYVSQIVKILGKITDVFLAQNKSAIANHVIEELLKIARVHLIKEPKTSPSCEILFEDIFRILESSLQHQNVLTLLTPTLDIRRGFLLTPYDSSSSIGLVLLIHKAFSLVKAPPEKKSHIDSFSDFLNVGEAFTQHFDNLAQIPVATKTHLCHALFINLEMIVSVYLQLIMEYRDQESFQCHIAIASKQVMRLLSFFSKCVENIPSFDLFKLREAVGTLTCIGLNYYYEESKDIALFCCKEIVSTINVCNSKNISQHRLKSFLVEAYYIRSFAQYKNDNDFVQNIDKVLKELPFPDQKISQDIIDQHIKQWAKISNSPAALYLDFKNRSSTL